MERDYSYPVWYTQGGGLAREVNGTLIFVEKPGCPGLGVGDEVPAEWDTVPANELAREEMEWPNSGPTTKTHYSGTNGRFAQPPLIF